MKLPTPIEDRWRQRLDGIKKSCPAITPEQVEDIRQWFYEGATATLAALCELVPHGGGGVTPQLLSAVGLLMAECQRATGVEVGVVVEIVRDKR